MQYVGIILILLAVCAFGISCRKWGGGTNSDNTSSVETASGRFLSKEDIEKQLEKIARTPPPKNLALGAMCYAIAPPPERFDYVCPVCGEKTLYTGRISNEPNAIVQDWGTVRTLSWELEDCRRLVQPIDKINITLIESQFCKHCSPEITNPTLGLEVKYNGAVHRTWGVTSHDLVVLKAFTDGKMKCKTFNEGEMALKSYLPRLRELLGAEVEVDDSAQ